MVINNIKLNADLYKILDVLRDYLRKHDSNYLQKEPRTSGNYIMIQCPYHKNGQENHPSAQLRIEDGLFFCHQCKESHSFYDFVSHCIEGNGKEWVLDRFDAEDVLPTINPINIGNTETEEQQYISSKAYSKYRRTHPYMFERKLTMDIIRKYDIGYDEDFIVTKYDNNGNKKEHHFGECITFPNKDINGNILFIARRCIHNKTFHYPENVDKPVYGLYEIYRDVLHGKKVKEVYICESMLDALYICTMGKYAVALNGLGTDKQFEILNNVPFIQTYILATDNDKSGKLAREKIRQHIDKTKFVREIDYDSYNGCKDVNDMTQEQFLNAKITGILLGW